MISVEIFFLGSFCGIKEVKHEDLVLGLAYSNIPYMQPMIRKLKVNKAEDDLRQLATKILTSLGKV